ncbi:hypothetical protein D3C86_2220090 [compost metagenome]
MHTEKRRDSGAATSRAQLIASLKTLANGKTVVGRAVTVAISSPHIAADDTACQVLPASRL